MLKTEDFNFLLPNELIAQNPNKDKEQTKLLVFKDNQIYDKKIKNLCDYFQKDDVILFNKVKVIKAKLLGKISRNNSVININLDQESDDIWQALCYPAKKIKKDDKIYFGEDFYAEVADKLDNGFIKIKFNFSGEKFYLMLEKYGSIPLPPYIKRNIENEEDLKNYQTIYAQDGYGVAAPTAGLHFTDDIFDKLKQKGVICVYATLNVGAGTFLPVRSEFVKDHIMHSEKFILTQEVCDIINNAKRNHRKIIAVGTTSLRMLESAVNEFGEVEAMCKDTNIFIYPPYNFKIVDILMTNFHLPKSTLFMLICAFIGKENAFKIYEYAIKEKYRFYSYGDASLLHLTQ
jgi:S-adenosylmethionine:tRNA ribosyltransferase-isomerase